MTKEFDLALPEAGWSALAFGYLKGCDVSFENIQSGCRVRLKYALLSTGGDDVPMRYSNRESQRQNCFELLRELVSLSVGEAADSIGCSDSHTDQRLSVRSIPWDLPSSTRHDEPNFPSMEIVDGKRCMRAID